jgi:hypothetical protein
VALTMEKLSWVLQRAGFSPYQAPRQLRICVQEVSNARPIKRSADIVDQISLIRFILRSGFAHGPN